MLQNSKNKILNSNITKKRNSKFNIKALCVPILEFGISLFWNLKIYAVFGNALLLKTSKIPTPVEIAISATLKIALKNMKCFPPKKGSQDGKFPSQIGK
jgi:hypothetical protein